MRAVVEPPAVVQFDDGAAAEQRQNLLGRGLASGVPMPSRCLTLGTSVGAQVEPDQGLAISEHRPSDLDALNPR